MFFFAVRISSASRSKPGREQDLDELLGERLRQFAIDALVEHDDAAVGAQRVGFQRAPVGVDRALAERDAAGVVVLDDHRGRRGVELLAQAPRAVEVEQVVERQRPAVMLADHREQVRAGADLRVVGGPLVGVLAVGQLEHLLVGADVQLREVVVGALGEPARDRRVVARGHREGVGGEALARRHREAAVGAAQLVEDRVVALGGRHDGDVGVVLGRGAHHRRPADVDVLDHLGVARARPPGGALERVEVDAHELDELDVVLGCGLEVLRVVAQREQPGIELRVQRLDAPVHDLREAGELVDRTDLEPRGRQLTGSPAGRDQLDAQRRESPREFDDPAFVGDREQRPADPHIAGRDRGAVAAAAGCAVGAGRDGPEDIARAGRGGRAASRCARSQARQALSWPSGHVGRRTRRVVHHRYDPRSAKSSSVTEGASCCPRRCVQHSASRVARACC